MPVARTTVQKISIEYRGSKLLNLLQENNLVPIDIQLSSEIQLLKVVNDIRNFFMFLLIISGNY